MWIGFDDKSFKNLIKAKNAGLTLDIGFIPCRAISA